MNKAIVLMIGIIMMISCKTVKQPVGEVPINYKERIVEKLVPVRVGDDSLSMLALFKCDSMNQVVLKQLKELKSKGVESDFSFDKGQLNYNAKAKHDTIYLPAKDSIIEREKPVRVEVPVEVNKLTMWQKIQIMAGKIFMWIAGICVIYFLGFKTGLIAKILKWIKSLF